MTERNMTDYFYYGQWGRNGESVSGPGSTVEYTGAFRFFLAGILRHLNVRTFIDAPCGDFNWMQHVDLCGIRYYGFDIVQEIVDRNQAQHGGETISFSQADICTDTFPAADLMMSRDVLFHLPEADIFRFFENFLKQDIPFLLTTSHHNRHNQDIPEPGGFRHLNLRKPPYNLPVPLGVFPDYPRSAKGLKHSRDLLLFPKASLERWWVKHG